MRRLILLSVTDAGRRLYARGTYTHLFGGTVWDQVRREPGGTNPPHGALKYQWLTNKPITRAALHGLRCHDDSMDLDGAPRLRRVRKVIAGVAIALGLSLLLVAFVLAAVAVIAGGSMGPGWSLALAITVALLATPLLLLGRAVWRRAGPPPVG